MNRLVFRHGAWVALLLAASAALAQPAAVAERYSLFPASADGIGKRYMGREISAVMGWQGAAWLEREERDREERTDLLLAALAASRHASRVYRRRSNLIIAAPARSRFGA